MTAYVGHTPINGEVSIGLQAIITRNLDGNVFNYVNLDVSGDEIVDAVITNALNNKGAAIDNTPVTMQSITWATYKPPSYFLDFYNRIIIELDLLELGEVFSDQQRTVTVWNGHFTPRTLDTITAVDDEGVTLTEPDSRPLYFGPIGHWVYTLDILSSAGAGNIATKYTFTFTTAEEGILNLIGQRSIVWFWAPNWEKKFTEKLSWLTDLKVSYNSTEQARKLRTVPRRYYEYETLVFDPGLLNSIIWRGRSIPLALPIWYDKSALTSSADIGDTVIYLDTVNKDFHVGGSALILTSETNYEVVSIEAVADSSLTIANSILSYWNTHTEVYPLRLGKLENRSKLNSLNASIQTLIVKFEFTDLSYISAVDSVNTYRSYPVFEHLHNWLVNKTLVMHSKLSILDYGTGIVTDSQESETFLPIDSQKLLIIGRQAIQDFRAWLYARSGRAIPIWLPTGRIDMRIAGTLLNTETDLHVDYFGYTTTSVPEKTRRDIRIELLDGTIFYRRILFRSWSGGSTEILTIDSTLAIDISPDNVRQISFMMFARLASDSVELLWENEEIIQTELNFTGKLDDV